MCCEKRSHWNAISSHSVTQLSIGGTTTLATEKGDIKLIATNIASQGDVNISAAKNLSIVSGQDTANNANQSNNKAIGQVVISDTERFAGYHNEKSKDNNSQVTQVASNVASLGGAVKLSAGDNYTQTASNVLAKGDIDITAKSVDITTANNSGSQSQASSDLKIGAFARVSSPLIDLVNNVEAARKSDGRLSTMQNMAAGANAYQTASAVSNLAGGAGSGTLIKGEVGIGFASSSNSNNTNISTAIGSSIKADGNVNITSTKGDITAQGATISAGQNTGTLTINSANNINLLASQSTNQSAGQNKNAGLEVGVGYQVGAQTGAYAYAAANVGSGNNNANSSTNNNTRLTGNTININSQGDTTLKGATATANTINADVKGKLSIESLQDTTKQASTQTNVGGRVQVSFGTAWEASGNASQNKGNGNSQAVKEQSGLIAGEGGYHIKADTVDLKGGAITSTNANKSDLSTNAITFQNIESKMDYKASSVSMAGSIGGGSSNANGSSGNSIQQQNFGDAKGGNVTPGLPSQTKGNDQSTTYATLSEGNITIAGKSSTAKELGINTDIAKANQQIATAPNIKDVLKEQQAMSAAAGTVIATSKQIAGDIASNAAKTQDKAQNIIDDKTSTPEQIADAKKVQAEAKQTQADWSAGGIYNQALGVVTALTVDKTAGQGGAATANAVGAVMAKQIGDIAKAKDWEEGSPEKVILHGLAGLVQAKLGGTSELTGFTAGATKEALTPLMESFLISQNYTKNTPEFDDMMKLGSTLVGAATGASVGGGAQNINAGANIALISETQNRQLHLKEIKFLSDPALIKRYIAYMSAQGQSLTEAQASQALDRNGSAMADEKWAALNGRDAVTESFIRKEAADAKLSYVDSDGKTHLGFSVTDAEYKNETINLKSMMDGYSNDPSVAKYFNNNFEKNRLTNWAQRYRAGQVQGQIDTSNNSSVLGDVGTILGGVVTLPISLYKSAKSDEIGPIDSARMSDYYQKLLKIQGRAAEAGYVSEKEWVDAQRLAIVGLPIAEVGGVLVGRGWQAIKATGEVGTNTGKLIPGEMKVVGTGLVAANDASYAVPKGYVQNIDGSITGPKGGTYTPTGKMDTSGNQIYREGNGGYFTLDAASGRTSVASPGPSATGTGRPTSQQSEVDVGAGWPANSQSQVSYLNGKEVPYGTAGSVRPDWCIGTVCSVEVKNYDVITNTRNLTDNVAQQAIQRAQNLPQGMTQTIVIDIRGQTVTAAQEFAIVQSIVQKSNGLISPKNISFKR